MGIANIAATIHADMCDDDRNGYSWSPRWGGDHPDGDKTLVIEGREYTYSLGSYDCSSSAITAWRLAVQYTSYAGCFDEATFTGDMRSVFVGSGLFEEWDTDSTDAERGDLYLSDSQHVAICQDGGNDSVYGYDALSEFSQNEFGEAYGGEVGDQTGNESSVHGYYSFAPCTLHYNGKADGEQPQPTPEPEPQSGTRYRVRTHEYGWHDWMRGLVDEGDSGDDFAGSEGCKIYGFEVEGLEYRIVRCDGSESINAQGNEDSPICGIEIIGDVDYQVHWTGSDSGWGKWEHGSDDNGAGYDEEHPLDMVRVR